MLINLNQVTIFDLFDPDFESISGDGSTILAGFDKLWHKNPDGTYEEYNFQNLLSESGIELGIPGESYAIGVSMN
ncbi:MAG: hypothetical protein ACO3ZW_04315 [Opitutales bacterium]|jgi:hypothetical protein